MRELSARSGGFRVLALSATPGQDPLRIQQVCTALMISRLEVRDEQSVDVVGHLNTREERMVMVPPGDDADYLAARDAVAGLYGSLLRRLLGMGVTHYGMDQDPTKVAQYTLVQLNQSLMQTPPNGMQQHMVNCRPRSNLRVASLHHLPPL